MKAVGNAPKLSCDRVHTPDSSIRRVMSLYPASGSKQRGLCLWVLRLRTLHIANLITSILESLSVSIICDLISCPILATFKVIFLDMPGQNSLLVSVSQHTAQLSWQRLLHNFSTTVCFSKWKLIILYIYNLYNGGFFKNLNHVKLYVFAFVGSDCFSETASLMLKVFLNSAKQWLQHTGEVTSWMWCIEPGSSRSFIFEVEREHQ